MKEAENRNSGAGSVETNQRGEEENMLNEKAENLRPKQEKMSRIVRERPEKRGRYVKYFETEDHGGAAVVYLEAVHYKENGEWKEIDNTLQEDSGKEYYMNRASDCKVRFAKKAGRGSLVEIQRAGHVLAWNLLQGKSAAAVAAAGKVAEEGEIKPICSFRLPERTKEKNDESETVTVAVEEQSEQAEETEAEIYRRNLKKVTLSNRQSGGMYPDIYPGVDLEYCLQGDVLKENIHLRTKEALEEKLVFALSHDGMKIRREQDGSLALYPEGKPEETVFYLDAPYMYDASGAMSAAVQYQAEETEDGSLLTVAPDRVWIESPDRVFPVTIDPNLRVDKKQTSIDDAFVRSKYPDDSSGCNYSELEVGRNRPYEMCRVFVKFNSLPELDKGAVITAAQMNIWQYLFSADNGQGFRVSAHKVTGAWNQSSLTWNTQPGYESAAMDYQLLEATNGYAVCRSFDVTKAVRGWYNDTGTNHGIMLKAINESVYATATLVSSDMPVDKYGLTAEQYPAGIVYYRNANGLEDYYSYHEQNLGRTGTGYVNNFNGNLVFVHPDEGTSGCLLPVSISHIYNLNDSEKDSRFGKGWRLSLMQELKATGDADFPYVFVDSDGTSHYFYKDTDDGDKLKDEDGLGLVITQTSSSDYDAYSMMEDKDKMQYVFGQDNYLRQIRDPVGNIQKMQYGPHADGNYFGHVDDPTGARVECIYTDDKKRLDHINANGRQTFFAYDTSGHLIKITYPDGKSSEFGYSGDKLSYAKTIDGITVSYQYVQDCGVNRVSEIKETAGSTTGTCIRISYQDGATTRFEEPGLDGNISSGSDNRIFTYHFNRFGSPVDISDEEGHVSSFQPYQEGMQRHKLRQSGVMGKTVYNYLKNPGFDSMGEFADAWGNRSGLTSGWGVGRRTDKGYFGNTSIYVFKNTAASYAAVIQEVSLPAGTYTLSAYAAAKDIPEESAKGAGLAVQTADGVMHYGTEYLTGTSDPDIDRGWKRLKMSFTIAGQQVVTVFGGIFDATGEAWFDCFQLEEGTKANRYNMIYNSRFVWQKTGGPADWRIQNPQTGDGTFQDAERGSCLKLSGHPDQEQYAIQGVYTAGEEGDVYSFGCYVKADAIPGKRFQVGAAVIYESGDPKWELIDCDPYRSGWQYVSGILSTDDENSVTKRKYTAIHFYVFYSNQVNPAYFTDLQLMKDDGPSYTYDSQGNLNTAKKTQENDSFHYSKKNLLSRMAQVDGTAYEYGYSSKRLLKAARNTEGLQSDYTYNEKGLPTAVQVHGGRSAAAVTVGRLYFIRQKKSGKYLDVFGGDVNGSNVHQYEFNGTVDQQWKVEGAGDGCVKFISQVGQKTRALDVADGKNADGINVQLYEDDNTAAQKFHLKMLEDGGYQILAKCSDDKRALDVAGGSLDNKANIQIYNADDETNAAQIWYFEPADQDVTGAVSDTPMSNRFCRFRARHSGQYLALEDSVNAVGKKLRQQYASGEEHEKFMLVDAGDNYYYIQPMHTPDKYLDVSTTGSDGYYRVTLQNTTAADSKKFKFVETGTGYAIENKNGLQLDVMHSSFTPGTDIIGTGTDGSALAANKIFVIENDSYHLASSMAYSSDGRNVVSVTDSRGYTTKNQYDSENRLLAEVTDAKGNKTSYQYLAVTDQLSGVSCTIGSGKRAVAYSYDSGDRLKSVSHNGTVYSYTYDEFGNQKAVSVGGSVVEQYSYLPGNGPLSEVHYGNGAVLKNIYDKRERIVEQKWNNQTAYRYEYDDLGALQTCQDVENGLEYQYRYDMTGRMVGQRQEDSAESGFSEQELDIGYDDKNRVECLVQKLGGQKVKTKYLYGDVEKQERPGLLYGMEIDGVKRQSIQYDDMGMPKFINIHLDQDKVISPSLIYGAPIEGKTNPLLRYYMVGDGFYWYDYDENGNIRKIARKKGETTQTISYEYDSLNQLIRENNEVLGKTICYTYDMGGNLTSRKEYALTEGTLGAVQKEDTFTYRSSGWKDQLLSYNGQQFAYDGYGNPTTYRDMTMTWQKGRRLASIVNGDTTATFAYDSEGQRIRKTVGTVTTYYYLDQGKIMGLYKGGYWTQFVYDAEDKPFMMRVNGSDYYYQYNGQGDVVGLVDAEGQTVVEYGYDSWGKMIKATDTSGKFVSTLNQFRYRGYVYDPETGLYYLGNRYYDPITGRFINADELDTLEFQMDSLHGKNLYQYCFNNPVNMLDDDGEWPKWITKVVIGTAVIAAAAALTVVTAGTGTALAAIAVGSLKGAAIGAAAGTVLGAGTGAITHRVTTGSWKGAGKAALNAGATGFAAGAVAGAVVGACHGYAKYKAFKVVEVGRLKANNHLGDGYPGVKYEYKRVGSKNKTVVHSIELHSPHVGENNLHQVWHWQLNRWSKKKSFALGRWRLWLTKMEK